MTRPSRPAPDNSPEGILQAQRNAAKRIVLFTVFLDILGFGIIIPQLGVYASQFAASPLEIGCLAAAYSTMQFLCAPLWGRLSDRIGRRPVLLWSIFGTAIGYVCFAFANSLPWLFAARIIDGITGGNISTAQAYLSDLTTPEERSKTFGIFGAIFGIGFALGPMIGSLLSHLPGIWGTNFGIGVFTAGLSLLNWALGIKRLPETLNPDDRAANIKRDADSGRKWEIINVHGFSRALALPGLNRLIVVSLFGMIAFATLQGTYTVFLIKQFVRPAVQQAILANPASSAQSAQTRFPHAGDVNFITQQVGSINAPFDPQFGGDFAPPIPQSGPLNWREVEKILVAPQAARLTGWIFTTIGIISLIVQGGLIGPLKRRFGELNLILIGSVIMAAALMLVPTPQVIWLEFPVMAILALGNGISGPVITSLVSQLAPDAERGEILGVFQSVQSLGRIIGPLLGGALFNYISASAPYFAGGAIMFASAIMAYGLRHMPEIHRIAAAAEPARAKS